MSIPKGNEYPDPFFFIICMICAKVGTLLMALLRVLSVNSENHYIIQLLTYVEVDMECY